MTDSGLPYPLPTGELHEALGINLNLNDFRQNAVIESVKIMRAKFLDDIVFEPIGSPVTSIIPNDIDDFDFSSTTIKSMMDGGQTPQQILQAMKAGSGPLQWQQSVETTYRTTFIKFLQGLKQTISNNVKTTLGLMQSANVAGPNMNDVFKTQDVKEYCVIRGISMDMDFNNQATLELSLPKLREINGSNAEMAWIPKENDLLVITLRFSDNEAKPVFVGLITGVSFTKEYGAITSINVVAFGLSKLMLVNKMVTDRAVLTQFEEGELAQTGLTPWSNYFANQTVDSIFQFLMTNEMGMRIVMDSVADKQGLSGIDIQRQNLISMREGVEANINSLVKTLSDKGDTMRKYLDETLDENTWVVYETVSTETQGEATIPHATSTGGVQGNLIEAARQYARQEQHEIGFITDIEGELTRIRMAWLKDVDGQKPELNSPNQIRYGEFLLFKEEIEAKILALNAQADRIRKEQEEAQKWNAPTKQGFEMKFNPDAFASSAIFQLTYLPLINLALWSMMENRTVAKFQGQKAVAFDLLLRNSFNLFFSQLQSPATTLNAIKSTSKYAVYENEEGKIVAEIPRYNEFLADTGEDIEEFIINNPMGRMEVVRQDLNLVTRLDSKQYIPMVDYLPYTFSSRQYTDIAVLAKYGMRTDAPIYNPNATSSQTAQLYAALEVTNQNANTRTITMEHPADRRFKLGRLYFIAVGDLNDKGGGPTGEETVDGYVGFLKSFTLNINYGNVIGYNLNFNYVRKAKLLISYVRVAGTATTSPADQLATGLSLSAIDRVYVANFKILPDLGSLIDAVIKAKNEGKLPEQDGAPPGSKATPIAGLANLYNTDDTHEDVYVNPRLVEPPYLTYFDVAPSLTNKFPLLCTKQLVIPSIAKPDYRLSRINVNPADIPAVPVIMRGDVGPKGGSLTRDLIWSLYFIDCRLRAYNHALYLGMGGILPATNSANYFKTLYIPNIPINNNYYWTDIRSLDVSVIHPQYPTLSTKLGTVTHFHTPGKYEDIKVRFIGKPIPTKTSANHFCILMIDDSHVPSRTDKSWDWGKIANFLLNAPSVSQSVTIEGSKKTWDGPMFGYSDFATNQYYNGVANIKQGLANIGFVGEELTRLSTEVDFAFKQLSDNAPNGVGGASFQYEFFLPVVIKIPTGGIVDSDVMRYIFPGYPMTLLDTANLPSTMFPGNVPFDKNKRVLNDQHAAGKALDITLAPYYATTGLALKSTSNHPFLNQEINPPISAPKTKKWIRYNGKDYERGSNVFYIVPDMKPEPNSSSAVTQVFQNTFSNKVPADFTFDALASLVELDKFWYHIGGNTPTNTESIG